MYVKVLSYLVILTVCSDVLVNVSEKNLQENTKVTCSKVIGFEIAFKFSFISLYFSLQSFSKALNMLTLL